MPVFGLDRAAYEGGGADRGLLALPGAGRTGPGQGAARLVDGEGSFDTVFVLGGGANRGALQVGMLRALCEARITPDLLVGTSIGAINAVAFAGEPTIEGVYLAADIWRRIVISEVFPRSRFHGTWRYFERREAVYPNDGLRKVVEGCLRFDRLEEAPIPVIVVATRLEDGVEEWISHGPATDAVLASAALPGIYPVVERDGSHYVDGGVLDNVAISAALAAKPRRVFVLLCSSVAAPVPQFDRPYEALLAAYSLNMHGRLRRDLANIPDNVDVVVFDDPNAHNLDMEDLSKTNELIERGYLSARQTLDDYAAAVERRSEVSNRLRRVIRSERVEKSLEDLFERVKGRGTPPDR